MKTKRIGISFTDPVYDRLKEVTQKYKISQTKLITCFVSLPDEEIKVIIDRYAPTLVETKKALAQKSKELAAKLSKLTDEQRAEIDALLSKVQ